MCVVQFDESPVSPPLIGLADGLPHMTGRELQEYEALRATIRERGTARPWIALAGLLGWALVSLSVAAWGTDPIEIAIPLVVLVGTFEIVFAMHTGVERVGRYIQVFFEAADETARWEHTAMAFGGRFGGSRMDALFSPVFWVATLFNLIPAVLMEASAQEWAIIGALHALVAWRIRSARGQAATQRAQDLERFTLLKEERASTPPLTQS